MFSLVSPFMKGYPEEGILGSPCEMTAVSEPSSVGLVGQILIWMLQSIHANVTGRGLAKLGVLLGSLSQQI